MTWQEANRDKARAASKRWKENNKEYVRAKNAQWQAANREKVKAYRLANQEKTRLQQAERYKAKMAKNPEKVREYNRNQIRARRSCSPKHRVDHRMSKAISNVLRQRGGKCGLSWEQLVGYTAAELKTALENAFTAGMNWGRFLAGQIEIDHVIPKSKFNYKSSEDPEFRQCWALENLQPKWKALNRRKHAKIEGPSQIPLGL